MLSEICSLEKTMQLPIITPAPLVKAHAEAFRDLFENRCQFRHFENYLTGLMVLPNKSMANITRCVIESSDKTNLSRYFSKDLWLQDQVNDRRIKYMLQETKHVRVARDQSALILDDTLCEHVGDLFEYVDRHYNHGNGNYPLAHNPVTSHYVSGPVRFPVDLRLYRRYEEVTRWEEFGRKAKKVKVVRLRFCCRLKKPGNPPRLRQVRLWNERFS